MHLGFCNIQEEHVHYYATVFSNILYASTTEKQPDFFCSEVCCGRLLMSTLDQTKVEGYLL